MALPVTITGLSTAVAPVGPFKIAVNQPPGTSVIVNTTGTVDFTGVLKDTASGMGCAQTVVNVASSTIVSAVGVYLTRVGSPTDTNLYAEIRATSPTGTLLATSNPVSASQFTLTTIPGNLINFVFPTPPTIAANATFCITIRRTVADSTNYIWVAASSATGYSGSMYDFINGVWTLRSGTTDLYFIIYKQLTISQDAYYFFGRDGTTPTTLQAFKSTSPDTSWASVATKTGFTTAILGINSYQVGYVIHFAINDGTASTSLATKYVSFDMSTDTFLAATETVSAAVAVTGQVAGAGTGSSIVVRNTGEAVVFYNGLQTKTSGTFRARVYYRRRTGLNTWTAEAQVDNNTASDNNYPIAILGLLDRVHFAWTTGAGSVVRTLNGATLQTQISIGISPVGDAVSYDRSGTTKVVITNGVGGGQATTYFDSADNPTINNANQTLSNAREPHRIGVDPDTLDVTIVYMSATDNDLYAIKSSNNGATFGSPVSFFVGNVALSDNNLSRNSTGGVYQRGGNVVVGYIVNDNGTLKFNEYILRVLTTDKTGPLVVVEGPDLAVIVGKMFADGTLVVVEASDVSVINGGIFSSGPLAVVEAADIAAITGTVANTVYSGSLVVVELADAASFAGKIETVGLFVVVEAIDGAAFVGRVETLGALLVSEATDAVVFIGTVANTVFSGPLVVVEAADVAAFVGDVSAGVELDYLRPDADTSTGGWTDQSGGTTGIYQSIDEVSANDSDFIQSPSIVSAVADLSVRLFEGSTEIVEWTHSDIASTFATATQTLTAPQFGAISNFSNLFVEFDDNNGNVYCCPLSDPAVGVASPVKLSYRYKKLGA